MGLRQMASISEKAAGGIDTTLRPPKDRKIPKDRPSMTRRKMLQVPPSLSVQTLRGFLKGELKESG